jgi:hypothetical protein
MAMAATLAALVSACSGSYQIGRQISLPEIPKDNAEANTPAASIAASWRPMAAATTIRR